MNFTHYKIILQTNPEVQHSYKKRAFCEEAAIILAQAEAIELGRGYKFVYSVVVI